MPDHYDVFLSYNRSDLSAANSLLDQFDAAGLSVFKDDKVIREGDLWLDELQRAVDCCETFVVLVGRDGVRRWVGAETQVALSRHFSPKTDAARLPIFPMLLPGIKPESLPAFLRLFQAVTLGPAAAPLPDGLIEQIRTRTNKAGKAAILEGCPFVGLASYGIDQAHLFFGRQKETLDALACFDMRRGSQTVRWLEINGNSGTGKSSLMQAGLLPLVDQGWLWPRTGYGHWRRIGPMMPGEQPVEMLAEHLTRAFRSQAADIEMADVRSSLARGDQALAQWLRGRKENDDTAFLLAIDQFEELFTFADQEERKTFDRLLTVALEDPECPLFVISTVRSDFLDRFAEHLPRLVAAKNRLGQAWTLAPISADGLREVIEGPARLADLDVGEVKEAMIAEAGDEPGALPLVENALHFLWKDRTDGRLSGRLLTDQGGLAGILSQSADALLESLDKPQRARALELLFRLVRVDPEGRRHTRQRMLLSDAVAIGGGGKHGQKLIDHLAGRRVRKGGPVVGPLRLITVTEQTDDGAGTGHGRWVNLIHETLIRSKGRNPEGKPQPYWPTLWKFIERNQERAIRWEQLQRSARNWQSRTGLTRLFGLAGWRSLFGLRHLAISGTIEHRFLRWSRGRALVEVLALAMMLGVIGESVYWTAVRGLPLEALKERWAYKLGRPLPLPELVEVPAGMFTMGSEFGTYSQPIHAVNFAQSVHIGRTEVTFEQWDACVAVGECNGYLPSGQGWGRVDRPVVNVSWDDAQSYAQWLGEQTNSLCRLPSEAEWEYAARAGTTTEYALPAPGGSDDIAGKGLANCKGCGGEWDNRRTAPVASFAANAWGLLDMHGNVWEWVEDCSHGDYKGAPTDGRAWLETGGGDCSSRVLRSGSWINGPNDARSADRGQYSPNTRLNRVGFRVVCSSPSRSTEH